MLFVVFFLTFFTMKVIMYCLINEQECFIPDKTRNASLLNGFKNEPFRKFIDVKD